MKLIRSRAPHPVVLYLVPALQLVLILIFFLLLSTTFLLQPGVAVNVPRSPFILTPQHSPRIISITAPPLSAIYYENQQVTEGQLRSLLGKARSTTETIIIKADRRAFYEQVSAVMNAALEMGFPVVLASTEEDAKK